jgi:hypothetical protein
MATDLTLRQSALQAGAADELADLNFEVFAHGTTSSFATMLADTQGGCLSATGGKWGGKFFTVPDLSVARAFAIRTCTNLPHEHPMVAGLALSREVALRLRANRVLTLTPVENPPHGVPASAQQWVFERGALEDLKRSGFFFTLK